ncbi:glycoside hydrolase family 108 protein [Vibrio parahaemolyticus]|uniref:glycoside hydrolase family 108 protein n=1 Tax=Vibrio parahaemolyticus TaxID=670 RepID=UPI003891401B
MDYPFSTAGYTPEFCRCVYFILEQEGGLKPDGGYVNNPKDSGGETKYGISKRAFPGRDIRTLTIDDAVRLYYTNYYKPAYCQEWSESVALYTLDAAVQHGAVNAIRMLQEISGCKTDGKVGPNTRAAVHSSDVEYLCARYGLRRARFYARIIKKDVSQVTFIEGWHNRLVALTDAAWECQ